jgi:hypothetical protein
MPALPFAIQQKNRLPSLNHHHVTGKFYSIICSQCNILAVKKSLVIMSHTFSTADGFLILKHLKLQWLEKLHVVSKNADCLLSMTWMNELRFIDSSELLQFSLSNLSKQLEGSLKSKTREATYKGMYAGFDSELNVDFLEKGLFFPKGHYILQYILHSKCRK